MVFRRINRYEALFDGTLFTNNQSVAHPQCWVSSRMPSQNTPIFEQAHIYRHTHIHTQIARASKPTDDCDKPDIFTARYRRHYYYEFVCICWLVFLSVVPSVCNVRGSEQMRLEIFCCVSYPELSCEVQSWSNAKGSGWLFNCIGILLMWDVSALCVIHALQIWALNMIFFLFFKYNSHLETNVLFLSISMCLMATFHHESACLPHIDIHIHISRIYIYIDVAAFFRLLDRPQTAAASVAALLYIT